MKRYGNLYPQIVDFDNLYLSARKAQKGKRFRPNVLEFNYHLETELLTLQKELINKTYQPGEYRTFHLRDIKTRLISAAPYRDRVVHHALCNIIVPIFERTFIRLKIHPVKSQLFETKFGATFLGFRILPDRIRVRNINLHRGRKRLKRLQKDYGEGKINLKDIKQSLQSWVAHLEHGDTYQLRKQIFSDLVFSRN